MKKIVLSLAVLATVALVSCGGKKAETNDSDSVMDSAMEVVDTTVADSAADSAAAATADQAPAAEVKADSAAK